MKHLIFIISLLMSVGIHAGGFKAGTLVKTPQGYVPIELLKKGDFVLSFDVALWPSRDFCVSKQITATGSRYTDTLIKLSVNGATMYMTADDMVYLPVEKEWIPAHSIRTGDMLLKECSGYAEVEDIAVFHQKTRVYYISVKDYHNLCVSPEDILVHNAPCAYSFATVHVLKNRFLMGSSR